MTDKLIVKNKQVQMLKDFNLFEKIGAAVGLALEIKEKKFLVCWILL